LVALAGALDARATMMPAAQAAQSTLARAERALARKQALAECQRVLVSAENALGAARRLQAGPSEEEQASLREAASERGLSAQSFDRGLAFVLTAKGAQLDAAARAELAQLRALMRLHPHGSVRIETSLPHRPSQTLARALGQDGQRARVELVKGTTPPGAPPASVRVVFAAYGHEP
jgi:hypothetical protein